MLTPARLVPVAGLAAHIGHGVQRIATDAAISRMRSIPRHIGELDAAYLARLTGHRIESMSALDVRGTLVTLALSAAIVLAYPGWWL